MADNNLVAKWTLYAPDADPAEIPADNTVQFFKDGSCLAPAALFGVEDGATYLFYQAFENGTIKLEPGTGIFFYKVEGELLTVKAMDGSETRFLREAKKSILRTRPADVVAKPAKEEEVDREPLEYEWKCPKCGKINQNYVGTCGCGEAKPNDKLFNWAEVQPHLVKKPAEPEAPVVVEEKPAKKAKAEKEKPAEPERVAGENEWKCPKCGKINQNYVGTCGCGERKPSAVPAPDAE